MVDKIKLGISTCLLGENVRYDGGHKLDCFLTDTSYVPIWFACRVWFVILAPHLTSRIRQAIIRCLHPPCWTGHGYLANLPLIEPSVWPFHSP